MDPVDTFNFEVFFHVCLGAVGLYLLARFLGCCREAAFLGGAVFAFCGYCLSLTGNIYMLFSFSFVPVAVLAWHEFWTDGKSRWLLTAVVVGVFQCLALGVEILILSSIFLIVWGLTFPYSRSVVWRMWFFAAAQALILGLVAIQVIPMIGVVAGSARAEGLSFEVWSTWSMNPRRLLELLIPGFLGPTDTLAESDYWGSGLVSERFPYILSVYLGVLPVGLAVAGAMSRRAEVLPRRFRLVLISVVGVFTLLSLGRFLPGMSAIYSLVPGAGLVRYPVKFLAVTILPLALLAAVGFHSVVTANGRQPRVALGVGAAVSFFGGPIALLWMWSVVDPISFGKTVYRYFDVASASAVSGVGSSVGRAVVVFLVGLLLILILGRRQRRWPAYGLGVLILVDLLTAARMVNPSASAAIVSDPPPIAAYLQSAGEEGRLYRDPMPEERMVMAPENTISHRVWFSREVLDSWVCWAYGIPTILHADFGGVASRGVRELGTRFDALGWEDRLRMLSASSVRWIISHRRFDLPGLGLVGPVPNRSDIELFLYRNRNARPYAYLVSESLAADSMEEAIERMVSPEFNPARAVILENPIDVSSGLAPPDGPGEILHAELAPNRWRLEVVTRGPSYLVFNENFDPGWHVRVDGRETEILRANGVFSAVRLGSGRHDVERWYRPPGLLAGGLVSGVSLLILVAWLSRRRSPHDTVL